MAEAATDDAPRPQAPTGRRSAAWSTLIANGLTVGLTVVQAFVLIPLCLLHLGPQAYGVWLAATELLLWVQLLDGGLPNLLMQRAGALAGSGDMDAAARWSSTTLMLLLLIGTGVGALALGAAPFVGAWADVPSGRHHEFVGAFRASVLAAVTLLWSNGCVGLSRGLQRTMLINTWQVAGAAAGLVTPIVLLPQGWGFWALAAGLLVRSALTLVGALSFLSALPRTAGSWWAHPSVACAREINALVPSMATANVTHVVATNSEILLVTSIFGPLPALTYALTRRALDGARNLLDTVAWATSGGFAHLVAAGDRHRSRQVLAEILWLRLALACVVAGAITAVNEAFVSQLFGAEHFGGLLLTTILALQMIATGHSFLANYLWRSTGAVREGSVLLTAESVLRIVGMYLGLRLSGMEGGALATVCVSVLALAIVRVRLDTSLPAGEADAVRVPRSVWPLLVFSLGVATAVAAPASSWPGIILTAAVVTVAGALVSLWALGPSAREGILGWSR